MPETELESKYLKNKVIENEIKYKKLKNYCNRLYRKERETFTLI